MLAYENRKPSNDGFLLDTTTIWVKYVAECVNGGVDVNTADVRHVLVSNDQMTDNDGADTELWQNSARLGAAK